MESLAFIFIILVLFIISGLVIYAAVIRTFLTSTRDIEDFLIYKEPTELKIFEKICKSYCKDFVNPGNRLCG